MANTINITACDNELRLIAYQWGASFEIATIRSGNSNSVNVTINISPGQFEGGVVLNGVNNPLSGTYPVYLNSGAYSLVAVGIIGAPLRVLNILLMGKYILRGRYLRIRESHIPAR